MAPAGTPPAVLARLNDALNQALRTDNVVRELRSRSQEPLGGAPQDAGADQEGIAPMGEHHQGRGHHARLTMRCPMTTGAPHDRRDPRRLCAAATNESAYRRVTVPVLRIDAGPGPAVALMAGVHGDEWEGQAAILELWHARDPEPRHGLSAARRQRRSLLAGRRLSPNDGGNLNRAFLGPARGYTKAWRPRWKRSCCRAEALVDAQRRRIAALPAVLGDHALWPGRSIRLPALARAFGLPHCIFRGTEAGSMPAAASRHGVLRLSAEIGGGAETGQALVDRCREGLLGCLHELGLLNREHARIHQPYTTWTPPPRPCAHGPGVFIPGVELASASRRVSAWAG